MKKEHAHEKSMLHMYEATTNDNFKKYLQAYGLQRSQDLSTTDQFQMQNHAVKQAGFLDFAY